MYKIDKEIKKKLYNISSKKRRTSICFMFVISQNVHDMILLVSKD